MISKTITEKVSENLGIGKKKEKEKKKSEKKNGKNSQEKKVTFFESLNSQITAFDKFIRDTGKTLKKSKVAFWISSMAITSLIFLVFPTVFTKVVGICLLIGIALILTIQFFQDQPWFEKALLTEISLITFLVVFYVYFLLFWIVPIGILLVTLLVTCFTAVFLTYKGILLLGKEKQKTKEPGKDGNFEARRSEDGKLSVDHKAPQREPTGKKVPDDYWNLPE